LVVADSAVVGNQALDAVGFGFAAGGGIFSEGNSLTVRHSVVSDNLARGSDGALTGGGSVFGGGIYSFGPAVVVTDSVLSGNQAVAGAAPGNFGGQASGGALEAGGGTLTIA